jgi:hypothetical protein
VFLVEKNTGRQTSLVMDAPSTTIASTTTTSGNARSNTVDIPQHTIMKHNLPTPSPSPDGRIYPKTRGLIREYVEIYDYAGGARFRGFVAEKDDERALFVFFDREVMGKDLKPGYVLPPYPHPHTRSMLTRHSVMSLLELASSEYVECSQLVICVDRSADEADVQDTTRDLGWVGFELMMLDAWSDDKGTISDRWLFLGMDV